VKYHSVGAFGHQSGRKPPVCMWIRRPIPTPPVSWTSA